MSDAPRNPIKYGWKRDLPDIRDYKFSVSGPAVTYPKTFDPRAKAWGVYDQLTIGSCTANGGLSGFRQLLINEGLGDFNGSRLAQYYWARYAEGTTKSDAGATIRDAVKVLATRGTAPEAMWPYNVSKVFVGPPAAVGTAAKKNLALLYQAVPLTQDAICQAVYKNGNVIIGISVYASFESNAVAQTGIVPLPTKTEQLLGGHCLHLTGYDLTKGWAIVKNSWGTSWGDKGYCYIPFQYLLNTSLASDFWTISRDN
jgi:C1A family cysteine protease